MRYAISTWNFHPPDVPLAGLIDRFAAMGFDTMSFLPRQLLGLDGGAWRDLRAVMDGRPLTATVHGKFDLTAQDVRRIVEMLGERLLCLTFDAAKAADSRGQFFDAARMAALLRHVEQASRGSNLRFGVEDFPLDRRALDHYRRDLGDLGDCPRLGMLIDVGHMHMRRTGEPYFSALSVQQYVEAAPLPIIEVHLHDNAGQKDSHGHFGFGTICFPDVAAALAKAGFDGVSTVEIAPAFYGLTAEQAMPHAAESLAVWRRLWDRSSLPRSSGRDSSGEGVR